MNSSMKTKYSPLQTSMPIRPIRLSASTGGSGFGYNHDADKDVTAYVTMQDITVAFIKILLDKKGISLEQAAKVTRLSMATISDILNSRPNSHVSLNTLHVLLHTVLRLSWADLDEVVRLASVNLLIVNNIRISEVKNTFKGVKRLPQSELEGLLLGPVTHWAYSKGHLSYKAMA